MLDRTPYSADKTTGAWRRPTARKHPRRYAELVRAGYIVASRTSAASTSRRAIM